MPKGKPNKRYTGEFKQEVVETMMREKLSYREAARQFEINDHNRVRYWERIYLEEGPEGLYIERRGRGSKGRPPKKLKAEIEEDLLAEVCRVERRDLLHCSREQGKIRLPSCDTGTAKPWISLQPQARHETDEAVGLKQQSTGEEVSFLQG